MDKDKSKGGAGQDAGSSASKDGLWHYEVPRQDAGAGAVQSNSGHYTGGAHGGDSQQGDFLKSPPEANAMPAGAPQTSRGSAGAGGADPQTRPAPGGGRGAGGSGEIASGGSIGGAGGAGAGDAADGAAGAGGGQPAPVGNGSKDEPIWGS